MSSGAAMLPPANNKLFPFSRAVTSRAAIPLAALFFFVILSEGFVRGERTNMQSKDPLLQIKSLRLGVVQPVR
jgi:hypothetical protein